MSKPCPVGSDKTVVCLSCAKLSMPIFWERYGNVHLDKGARCLNTARDRPEIAVLPPPRSALKSGQPRSPVPPQPPLVGVVVAHDESSWKSDPRGTPLRPPLGL